MSIAAKMRDRWPEMRKSKARQVSTNDIGIQTIVFVLYLCCIVCKWRPMTSTSRQLSTQHLRIYQAAIAEIEIKGEAGRQREAMSFLFVPACRLFSSKEKDGESSMRMPSLYWGERESELLQRQMTLGDNGAKLGHQLAYFARTLGRILTGTINGGGIRSLPPKATCSIILFSVHSHQPCVSADPDHHKHSPVIMCHNQTSQELRMLSSVTLNS